MSPLKRPKVRNVDATTYKTPLTDVPDQTVGTARLRQERYASGGYYNMEGTGGYEYFRITKGRLPVTTLQIREGGGWKTWMVDDPLHWEGMRERVQMLPTGPVLVAGLGLGLMLHHMAERDDLGEIVVVERNPDVIELIRPTLPADPRVQIVLDDYYEYIDPYYLRGEAHPAFASVLWDLAVGGPEQTRGDFVRAKILTSIYLPTVELFCFGQRIKR